MNTSNETLSNESQKQDQLIIDRVVKRSLSPREFADKIWGTQDLNDISEFNISLDSAIGMIENYEKQPTIWNDPDETPIRSNEIFDHEDSATLVLVKHKLYNRETYSIGFKEPHSEWWSEDGECEITNVIGWQYLPS